MHLRTNLAEVSNRKMAIEKLRIDYKDQNKTCTNPQIKNHKKSHGLKLTRPQTQHRKTEHMYLKFLTRSVEKIVNPHGLK